jgi:hypothetical protein
MVRCPLQFHFNAVHAVAFKAVSPFKPFSRLSRFVRPSVTLH